MDEEEASPLVRTMGASGSQSRRPAGGARPRMSFASDALSANLG
jgi:hypothetical protein